MLGPPATELARRSPPCPADKTADEINSPELNSQLNEIMSQLSGQCADYITSVAAASKRLRSLLQQAPVKVTSQILSATPGVSAGTTHG